MVPFTSVLKGMKAAPLALPLVETSYGSGHVSAPVANCACVYAPLAPVQWPLTLQSYVEFAVKLVRLTEREEVAAATVVQVDEEANL